MTNIINKVKKNAFLVFCFLMIYMDLSFGEDTKFKSRLLFKKTPEVKNLDTQTIIDKKKLKIPEAIEKTKADQQKINTKKKKSEGKSIKILYLSGQVEASEEDIDFLVKNISVIDKNKKINIHAYASKGSNQTSSDARRLSLSRALSLRRLLISNKFSSTNIYIRAMGAEPIKDDIQDIVIININ